MKTSPVVRLTLAVGLIGGSTAVAREAEIDVDAISETQVLKTVFNDRVVFEASTR